MPIQAHSKPPACNGLHAEAKPAVLKNFLRKFKPVLIMKLAFVIILFACLQVSAKGYSQLITLKERNATLEQILKKIKSQSGHDFFYNLKSIEMIGRISIDVKNVTISQALDICFKNTPLTYSISGNIIVISKREESAKKSYASLNTNQREDPYALIRGRVENELGQPLAGATVSVKGKNQTMSTNENGAYEINAEENDILVITYIGYKDKEVPVNGLQTINVRLDPEADNMQGVVVVAYGTQKKGNLTSSISEIKGQELTRRPVSNVQQSLQGLAPGVTVLDLGGPPGRSEATIRVRGITTFNINGPSSTYGGYDLSKNDALVIIDGIEQRLSDFNPDDIESISVLKDASSTAIYGSRATNGVILITTKRAKGNKVAINYHGYYGIQKSINSPKMMDLESYMRMQVAAYTNSGVAIPARFSDASINDWVNATDREKYPLPNTWYETLFSPAPQHNHSLAIAGGNDILRTRLSTRLMNQDGIAPNYDDKLREIKLNTDFTPFSRLALSADINYRANTSTVPTVEPFQNILHGSLWAVPKYADGTYGLSSQGNNPLMYAEIGGTSKLLNELIIANLKAEFEIIKGLKFSTQYGFRANNQTAKNYANAYTNIDKNTNISKVVAINSLTEVRNTLREYTWNNILRYERLFDKHNVKALAGYSEIDNDQTFLSAYRERFYNNDIQSIGQGTNDGTKSNSGSEASFGLRSYFGRINYAFNDKYLFEANGRYDGSSKFTGSKRYSFFPSFSVGWRISEEKLWKGVSDIINDLKLRASWGKQGNQSVGLYSYYSALSLTTYTFNSLPVQGYRQSTLANTELGWETTTQTDVGLDAAFLDSRLTLTVDYYKKTTDDILLNLQIPATIGLTAPPQNAGSVENKGFEFAMGFRSGRAPGKFRYNVNGHFSINDNKVTSLRGTGPYITGSDNYPRYIISQGLPINTLWGYKTDGLFQTNDEAANYPTYAPNSKAGDVKYLDLNGDKKIDAKDMTNIGYTFPKYTFGLNTDFSYKNFELNILVQGAAKVNTRLGGAMSDHGNFEAFAHEILTNNYWTPSNPNARFPRPLKFDFRNGITSDRTVLDGSYVRVKNIQLAYNVKSRVLTAARINSLRLYVSGTNLITFSELNDWNLDPEVEPGVAVYYPQVSLYTFGVNIQF